jgi:hypothetical protein
MADISASGACEKSFDSESSQRICQERKDLFYEISSLTPDLELSGYPQDFIDCY